MTLLEKFDLARTDCRQWPPTISEAIDIFINQTEYEMLKTSRTRIHEMMHVLAGATSGLLSDEGRTFATEMVIMGQTHDMLGESRTNGKFYLQTATEANIEEIRTKSDDIQKRWLAYYSRIAAQQKLEIALEFANILERDNSAPLFRQCVDKREKLWSDELLVSLTTEQQNALLEKFAENTQIQRYERALKADILTEEGFQKALKRAHAIKLYFSSTHENRPFLDFSYEEIMAMSVNEFGINAVKRGHKTDFIPFINTHTLSPEKTLVL